MVLILKTVSPIKFLEYPLVAKKCQIHTNKIFKKKKKKNTCCIQMNTNIYKNVILKSLMDSSYSEGTL